MGEHWLFIGPNGAGKTTFAKALAGLLPLKTGEIIAWFSKKRIRYISFETEQQFFLNEEKQKEFASYVGTNKKGKTVRAFLGKKLSEELVEEFHLKPLLGKEVTKLSTGEMRKVFLVKTLLAKPKLFILDEPFNGLDKKSRLKVVRFLDKLAGNLQIILITHDLNELPKAITHVMAIENGKIGSVNAISSFRAKPALPAGRQGNPTPRRLVESQRNEIPPLHIRSGRDDEEKEKIIEMKNVSVQFGTKKVLQNITWTVRKGENWAILGPNGAGKSTLVKLITGDSLQVHANDIRIFGKHRRELSLWDLREYLGYVSPELQIHIPKDFKILNLFNSEKTLKKHSLEFLASKSITKLSPGQMKMILILREIERLPQLLILDEPCQHLDQENRKLVLELIDKIGRSGKTNILLITHHEEEVVSSISHVLRLDKGKAVVVQ